MVYDVERSIGSFYPSICFAEMQPLLLRLLSRQIGEEVPYERLFCFVPAQIVLCTLNHQLQPSQRIPQLLLQPLEEARSLLIYTQLLRLMAQVTGCRKQIILTQHPEVFGPQ